MPTLDELLNKAIKKTEKKKFSRGNRPDTMLRGDFLNNNNDSSEKRAASESVNAGNDSDQGLEEKPKAESLVARDRATRAKSETDGTTTASASAPIASSAKGPISAAAATSTSTSTSTSSATSVPSSVGPEKATKVVSEATTTNPSNAPTGNSKQDSDLDSIPPGLAFQRRPIKKKGSSREDSPVDQKTSPSPAPSQTSSVESSLEASVESSGEASVDFIQSPSQSSVKSTGESSVGSSVHSVVESPVPSSNDSSSIASVDSSGVSSVDSDEPIRSGASIKSIESLPSELVGGNDPRSLRTTSSKKSVQDSEPTETMSSMNFTGSSDDQFFDSQNLVRTPSGASAFGGRSDGTQSIDEIDLLNFEPSSNLVQTRFKSTIDDSRTFDLGLGAKSSDSFYSREKNSPSSEASRKDLFKGPPDRLESTNDVPLTKTFGNENNIETRFKPSSNQVQTTFKPSSNPVQTRFELGSDMSDNEAELDLNLVQTRFEPSLEPRSKVALKKLSPLQISILEYLNDLCIELRSDVTSPVKISDIVTLCHCSTEGAKTAIKRMIKQNVMTRIDYKDGRNGWCQYKISSHLHRELIEHKKTQLNLVQTRFKPGSELGSNAPSKLVSNNINNTNLLTTSPTNQPPSFGDAALHFYEQGPQEFFDVSLVNIEALTKHHISRKQIQDIKNQKLQFTQTTLQDFVDRFAVYASDPKNLRNVNNVPGVFVKMAQMASKGEDPLSGIETEADRLIQEQIERLKAKRNERIKHQNELIELEFENWLIEIQPQGQDEIVPPTPMIKSGSIAQRMILKDHFVEEVWPERSAQFGF